MTQPKTAAPVVTWASNDGIRRHAFVGRRVRWQRTACGLEGWDQRYDRPAPVRCVVCEAALVEAPLPLSY